MGVVMQAGCTKCAYSEELFLGSGVMFGDLNSVRAMFDGSTAAKIVAFYAKNDHTGFDAEYTLTICDKCNKVGALPVVTFFSSNGEETKFFGKCDCGSENVRIIPTSEASCPQCKAAMILKETGRWD